MEAIYTVKRFINGFLKAILNIAIVFLTLLNFGFFIRVIYDNDRVNALINDIDNFLIEHQQLDEKLTNTLKDSNTLVSQYLKNIN